MAISTTISQKELKRQAGLVFEGKTLKVLAAVAGLSGYTVESTVANWQSVELASANGYVRGSYVIGTGAYDAGVGAYKLPDITVAFTASGGTLTFDSVALYINGETYLHSLITETPAVTLAPGQTQTYVISLLQDN